MRDHSVDINSSTNAQEELKETKKEIVCLSGQLQEKKPKHVT